jgi:hypothetical protein
MTNYQKKVNQRFFEKMIILLGHNKNNIYFWHDELESYRIVDGCLVGSSRGINKIKNITPNEFHSKLIIG